MAIDIVNAESHDDLVEIANLAHEIWNECFVDIITQGQIDYMVERFQSLEAMENQVKNDNYTYFGVFLEDDLCGYIGVKEEEDRLFLSKLYLHSDYRGKGIASQMLQRVFDEGRRLAKNSVYLTVNKHNTQAIEVYLAKGFKITDIVVTDIGEGYVMDDYIFEYPL